MLDRGFACADCGSESFIIKGLGGPRRALKRWRSLRTAPAAARRPPPRSRSKRLGVAASTTPSKASRPRQSIARSDDRVSPRTDSLALLYALFTEVRGRVILRSSSYV